MRLKIFDKISKKIERLDSFFDNTHYFYRTVDIFIKRQRSMKTSLMRDTKTYTYSYYLFRVNTYGYKNTKHDYHLTGKLHDSLKLFMRDRVFYFYSQADYLLYLFHGTLGKKVFPLVAEAWRIGENEKEVLINEIVSKIYLYVNASKI